MNSLNYDLTDLLWAIKERPLSLLKELGVLPLHNRDDFKILCDFLSKEEFPDEYPEQELDLTEALFDPHDVK